MSMLSTALLHSVQRAPCATNKPPQHRFSFLTPEAAPRTPQPAPHQPALMVWMILPIFNPGSNQCYVFFKIWLQYSREAISWKWLKEEESKQCSAAIWKLNIILPLCKKLSDRLTASCLILQWQSESKWTKNLKNNKNGVSCFCLTKKLSSNSV